MHDVFISYSRKDKDFVRQLKDALAANQRDVWVDSEDIPLTADWRKEVYAGIEAAQNFVFVLSPDSIISEVCGQELAHAVEHNKRLVPIVWRQVDSKQASTEVGRLNWIFFRASDDFTAAIDSLIKILDTDLEWVRVHTRLLTRAIEWDQAGRDASLLLRGKDLQQVEQWLAQAISGKEPRPTALQTEYIQAGEEAQRQEIQRLRELYEEAERQRKIAVSRELAVSAISQAPNDPELSLLLAIEAAQYSRVTQVADALRQGLLRSHVRLVLRGHTGPVNSAAFSHDGQLVATAGEDATARVWEATGGAMIAELQGHSGAVKSMAFSPDDKLLATASEDGCANVWDIATGKCLSQGYSSRGGMQWDNTLRRVAFSPDGRWVVSAAGKDNTARMWEAATGGMITELTGHKDEVMSAAYSSDGKLIVTASMDQTARVWDAKTGRTVAILRAPGGQVTDAVFSPDSTLVATTGHDMIPRVWDARRGTVVAVLRGGSSLAPRTAAFSPNGKWVLITYFDTTARVWNVGTLKESKPNPPAATLAAELRGHTERMTSGVFHPDGRFGLTSNEDGTARIWDVHTGREIAVLRGHASAINSAVFSPEGKRVVTASRDGTARIWDAATGAEALDLPDHLHGAFSPDNNWLAAVGRGGKDIWDLHTGRKLAELQGDAGWANDVNVSPDAKFILVACADTTARLYDSVTGQERFVLRGHTDEVNSARFSRDGKFVLTASKDHTARVWEAGSGSSVMELRGHGGDVSAATFSPDGRLVLTQSWDGTGRVWHWETGQTLAELCQDTRYLWSAAFSPDSQLVVTSSGNETVRIYGTKTGEVLRELSGHAGIVNTVQFSPDGQFILTASADGTARVWEAGAGRTISEIRAHTWKINSAVFSHSGEFALTGNWDKTARLWEASTGRALLEFRGNRDDVKHVAFSPDDQFILAESYGGGIKVFSCEVCASLDQLLTLAQARITRQLTPEERQIYLHENLAGTPETSLAAPSIPAPPGQ